MSIHFVSGKPGGGKSLYGMKLILDELLCGERVVVTNLAVKLGALNAYLQRKDEIPRVWNFKIPSWLYWILPDWLLNLLLPFLQWTTSERVGTLTIQTSTPDKENYIDRVLLLTDDELASFFCHRPAATIGRVTKEEWRFGKRPDYTVVKDSGVFFVLDEVHIAFNARAWAETGAEVLYYLSQHRKLGDDVVCITQSVGNVDKQFRSVAQDFTYIRNIGKETWGKFKMPLRFIRKTYAQPATDTSKPLDTGSFGLDVAGIASCYDTARGVGIHGRTGADTKARTKGFHWSLAIIIVGLLIFGFLQILPIVINRFTNVPTINGEHRKETVSQGGGLTNSRVTVGRTNFPSELASENLRAARDKPKPETPEVTMTGFMVYDSRHWTVCLSDGSTYDERDSDLTEFTPKYCIISGKRYNLSRGRTNPKSKAEPEGGKQKEEKSL